ncbi:MAG: Tex family protein [Planctomycetaceae bacterium]
MDEPTKTVFSQIASELQLTEDQVAATVALLDAGNTIPFLTRYRKEQTGDLNEIELRAIQERIRIQRQIAERASTILRLLESQGQLTDQLRQEILNANCLKRLEDLYLPFRPKRLTRAEIARRQGLEEFAKKIWDRDPQIVDLQIEAEKYVSVEAGLESVEDVLRGVRDLLAERISEDITVREALRKTAKQSGRFAVTATKEGLVSGLAFRDYFDYSERISHIPPHRALAINRGERLGFLKIKWDWDDEEALETISRVLELKQDRFADFLRQSTREALTRLLIPSLEREFRRDLTERAQSQAVKVFTENLRKLLLQPPVRGRRVLALDPGFRTGCKVAVLDENGQCLAHDVIYVTGSADRQQLAKNRLIELLQTWNIPLIAIGNGTAGRETEELVSEMIAEALPDVRYMIVNEAGASIYSASPIAREEFPDLDATVRGTISLGRRLLDPLSELVKIDPEHLGIGMYQHDVDPKLLRGSLDDVIESCVNFVGVDLNTASAPLLKYVSGLNQVLAQRVVAWRNEHGRFASRDQLREIPGVGDARFTQAAGFLKIVDGEEPLDQTWIHPESYHLVKRLFERLPAVAGSNERGGSIAELSIPQLEDSQKRDLASELNVGISTLSDIIDSLARPGRDPRIDLPNPCFKKGILKLSDVAPGMELKGTVLNVVDFGVFVDIGLKDSALVHISQLSHAFVDSPHDLISVGDVVTVWVLQVDQERRRVSLTMVSPEARAKGRSLTATDPGDKRNRKVGTSDQGKKLQRTADRTEAADSSPQKKVSTANSSLRADPPEARDESPDEAHPPHPADAKAASQTLRGFDELKRLWKNRPR